MIATVIQIIIIFIMPIVLFAFVKRSSALKFIGPIMLAYAVGILFANVPIFQWDRALSMSISEIAVPIAIVLVLMSTNLIAWFKLARTTVLSFSLMMIAALLASFVTVLIFRQHLPISWKIAGMLTGCYTGGTPNLISVGLALEVPSETVVLVNTSDMLWGGLYFLLLTSVMKKVYRRFLPPFKNAEAVDKKVDSFMKPVFGQGIFRGLKNIGITVSLALVATAISVGISLLLTGEMSTVFILLFVTTLGIAISLSKKMHTIEGTWNIAEYVILLFSIGLGGTVDIKAFITASPTMLLLVGTMMISALVLHFILCKVFNIDADTALITSTAGIYGPAFIAPVAKTLNNQAIIVSGLITGLAGYALGNYLGIIVAFLLKLLG